MNGLLQHREIERARTYVPVTDVSVLHVEFVLVQHAGQQPHPCLAHADFYQSQSKRRFAGLHRFLRPRHHNHRAFV